MKKKILAILICGVVILGITGCGNEKDKVDSNDDTKVNENQSASSGEIKDWNKNRKGDSLSSSDEQQDGIIYKVEKMEDGNYILFYKNTNDYGINLFADLNYYDSTGTQGLVNFVRRTVPCMKTGTVGALVYNDITQTYASYGMKFTVQEKTFEDGSNKIGFKETEKDNKLKITAVNNNDKDLANLNAVVVFYKGDKILTAVHEDNGYGGLNVVKDYPADKDGNKLDYDRYEIYLNSAYISQ